MVIALLESIANVGHPELFSWPMESCDPQKMTQMIWVFWPTINPKNAQIFDKFSESVLLVYQSV